MSSSQHSCHLNTSSVRFLKRFHTHVHMQRKDYTCPVATLWSVLGVKGITHIIVPVPYLISLLQTKTDFTHMPTCRRTIILALLLG